jgi:nucleoside recognition membrane protein YjiH
MTEAAVTEAPTPAPLGRFLVPSAVGAGVFLLPVLAGGAITIPFSLITDAITALIAPVHELLLVLVLAIGAVGALAWPLLHSLPMAQGATLRLVFDVHWTLTLLRTLGAVFALMVFFEAGPEFVVGPATGGTVFRDICMAVLVIYVASAFLMGLLTDYGLMEFVGELLRAPFQRLFRLPGRAAVDSLASFVSASGVGLLITVRQYEMRTYTAREACVICCSFSIISLPFALLISQVAGVGELFLPWYLTIAVACLAAAYVIARVGPMAHKPETRYGGDGPVPPEPAGGSALERAMGAARLRAASAVGPRGYLRAATVSALDYCLGLLGPIMAVATLVSMLVFRTPIFDWLALPVVFLLDLFAFPEAGAAGKGFLVGALDQFMPALVAQGLESEFARFVLAGLSVAQLVYLSEFGVILLRSSLPITLGDLFLTFVLRTLVVTPFLLLGAWLLT